MHLLIIASLMIPTVLGGCCFPKQLFGLSFTTNQRVGHRVAMDFSASKFVFRNLNASVPGFQLFDYPAGKLYTKGADGSCKFTSVNTADGFKSCIPANAKLLGTAYMGNPNFLVTSYQFMLGNRNISVTVSNDKCYPIISVSHTAGQSIDQSFVLANLVETDPKATQLLNPDTSNCVSEDGVIG